LEKALTRESRSERHRGRRRRAVPVLVPGRTLDDIACGDSESRLPASLDLQLIV